MLDTGLPTRNGSLATIDMSPFRLLTDPSDNDGTNDPGHGHVAISVMVSTRNNNSGVAASTPRAS